MPPFPRWVSLRPDLERGEFHPVAAVRSWRSGQTTVLFDRQRSLRYSLEGDGERIWMLLRNGASLHRLVDQILREREVRHDRNVYTDIAAVLDGLLKAKLIEQRPYAVPDDEPPMSAASTMTLPSAVVVLATAPPFDKAVLSAIESFAPVEFAGTIAELRARLRRGGVAALVVATLEDAESVLIADGLDEIAARHPSLPKLLYRESIYPGRLEEMVARGWRLKLVEEPERLVSTLRDSVSSGSLFDRLAKEVEPLRALLPRELAPVLDLAASCAVQSRPAGEVAEGMNVTQEGLRHALAEAGWPPPKVIVAWLRRILAAMLLGRPGATVREVAATLGYHSPRSLSKLFESLPGFAPRELLDHDRASEVRARFETFLRPGNKIHAPPSPS